MFHIFYIPAVLALGFWISRQGLPKGVVVEFRDVEGRVKKDISVAEAALKSKVQSLKKKI